MTHTIFDCTVDDISLERLIARFVAPRSPYYFNDSDIMKKLLETGIAVYTRKEFAANFPTFSLDYGSLYNLWNMDFPELSVVVLLSKQQFLHLDARIRAHLLEHQVQCGRGHIYLRDWFSEFVESPKGLFTFEGREYYSLTSEDWWDFNDSSRKQWFLKWMKEWRKEQATGVLDFPNDHKTVPYPFIREYAGTFADTSGPNCFAAAIGTAVAAANPDHQSNGNVLIHQWMHPEPFFRLLQAIGYDKTLEVRNSNEFRHLLPADVLVWESKEGVAIHAAFAVSNDLMFQKQGQGWECPWQVLRLNDVGYSHCLDNDGIISIHRKNG